MRHLELRGARNRLIGARECRGLIGLLVVPMMTIPLVLMICHAGATVVQITEYHDDIAVEGYTPLGSYWDLTLGDLVITYTLDMSEYAPTMWQTGWSSIGIGGGALGWMASGAPAAELTNPVSQDMDDKLNLGAPDRCDEWSYDALAPDVLTTAPIGSPGDNYGVWFDRDGVDQSQDDLWGMTDGATYNTGGVYDVVLTIHSIDGAVGTMFVTVNGVQTGFYATAWKNAQPDFYPVGKSIAGDLTMVQVFASVWGVNVKVYDLTATGFKSITADIKPGSDVNPVNLGSKGRLPVAVMGSSWFDINTIDHSTVRLEGTAPDGVQPTRFAVEDINSDGYMDVLYLFDMIAIAAYGVEDEEMSISFSVEGQLVVLEDYVTFVGKTG